MAQDTPESAVYIIIVNWNGKALLNKCLKSMFQNTFDQRSRVVVVDNASTDSSVELVRNSYHQVALIRNTHNEGFSKANNQGICYALERGAKYIILLNNDIEVTNKNWLEEFTAIMESDQKIGIVGCKLIFPNGILQHAGGLYRLSGPHHRGECERDSGQYNRVELVDYVTGAALMIKGEVIRKIGLLDEGFSPLYYEDTDLCARANLSGYAIAYTPKPTLIHHCGASSNKLGSERKKFYAKKNFIRFVLLNYQTKDILKKTLLFDTREFIRCLVVKSQNGRLPIVLRSDAATRLILFWRPWQVNIRNLKEIIYLRRQRFASGAKLHV